MSDVRAQVRELLSRAAELRSQSEQMLLKSREIFGDIDRLLSRLHDPGLLNSEATGQDHGTAHQDRFPPMTH
jgi:hypothetical protein